MTSVKRLLTITITGCEQYEDDALSPWKQRENYIMPWIKVADVLDKLIGVLDKGSELYKVLNQGQLNAFTLLSLSWIF